MNVAVFDFKTKPEREGWGAWGSWVCVWTRRNRLTPDIWGILVASKRLGNALISAGVYPGMSPKPANENRRG